MRIIYLPLISAKEDFICFASNNQITSEKELMMTGEALHLKRAYPTLPKLFGEALQGAKPLFFTQGVEIDRQKFLALQTQEGWTDVPKRALVQKTIDKLEEYARNTKKSFAIPLIGHSYGGLTKKEVFEMLKPLPDNVILFTLDYDLR